MDSGNDARVPERDDIRLGVTLPPLGGIGLATASSIDMYNNDVGKKSAQKFMKQTGDLKAATLYFAS
jgi:hypothetical protein